MRAFIVPCSLLLAATLTACGDAPTNPEVLSVVPQLSTQGHGQPIIQDFNFDIFNGCTGEGIDFTGTLVEQVIQLENGFRILDHLQAVGIGKTTGNTYHIDTQFISSVISQGATTIRERHTFKVISNGSNDNFLFDAVLVITANANGDFVFSEFVVINVRCVG